MRYGSRVGGYNRPDSDIDLLVVLKNYPYVVKYIYITRFNMAKFYADFLSWPCKFPASFCDDLLL
jgi:predicted nucleotidyltransferase